MNNLFVYLIQSGMSVSILFGIYWIFLRRDTFYKLNRFFLLSALFGSFIFPLFKISIAAESSPAYVHMLEEIVITPEMVAQTVREKIGLGQLMLMVYLLGVIFLTLRFIHQIIQILLLVYKHGIIRQNGLKLVILENGHSPFSFLDTVFISREYADLQDIEKILEHEKIHIKQLHSFDVIVLELATILQWFNPFVWLYKRNLKGIHEFLADEGVLRKGYKSSDYQQLLIQQTLGIKYNILSNNLNKSLIKKRFIMMSKTKTKKSALLKMVFIIPAALFFTLVFTFSITEKVMAQAEKGDIKVVQQASTQDSQEETVFTVVEEMPTYPGGQDAMIKYLSENIKYPENARKSGIQGIVFVTYVVEKNGTISDVRILRGVNEELDAEALRVVSAMPAWSPGKQRGETVRVQFNLPINFKLDGKETRGLEKTSDNEPPMPYMNQKKVPDSSYYKDKHE